MTYTTLLFDIDDTLLNFTTTETRALEKIFAHYNIPYTTPYITQYKEINHALWVSYEQGIINQQDILNTRFKSFLSLHGYEVNGTAVDQQYRDYLSEGHDLIDGAKALIEQLYNHADLYIVTNGISDMQHRRLKDAGLHHYFKGIFVSEETGFKKPMKAFFDYVFERIPGMDLVSTVVIGDRLSADVLGAHNAGVDSIWFNPSGLPNDIKIQPTFTISHLSEIPSILNLVIK